MNSRTHQHDIAIISLLGITSLAFNMAMAWFVTERLPHLEDEIAYLFQAQTYLRGELYAPPPPAERAFFVPFVVMIKEHRVGKYSIGWPLVLALGEMVGAGWLVNPILGALTVMLIYRLGCDVYNRSVGTAAGVLALASPLFLIQSATYMNHALAALCTTLLMWSIFRIDQARQVGRFPFRWAILAGSALGLLMLTRPFSGVAVALPFAVVALWQIARAGSDRWELFRVYLVLAGLASLIALLQPLYLYLVTGDPLINLYTLVWKYDQVGFGPDFGRHGHTLQKGLNITRTGLTLWISDSFGWPYAGWLPLLPGLALGGKQIKPGLRLWSVLLCLPFVMLVIFYIAYWVGEIVYGPRYFYEGLPGLAIVAAAGLNAMASSMASSIARLRQHSYGVPLALSIIMLVLLGINGAVYLPYRIPQWYQLYGIKRQPLDELEGLRQTDRVLVLVRSGHWHDYGEFIYLNSPWYDTPIIVAHDYNPQMAAKVIALYPDREVWYYNGSFSSTPSPYIKESP
jgi:4-amino-4-deoxy-L-arabinose transferase-like glycosyltransferase